MAAMEACLAARRVIAVPEQPKTAAEMMAEQMKAAVTAPPAITSTGPAAGNGYEILLQVSVRMESRTLRRPVDAWQRDTWRVDALSPAGEL
jgi:hypothetical protein